MMIVFDTGHIRTQLKASLPILLGNEPGHQAKCFGCAKGRP